MKFRSVLLICGLITVLVFTGWAQKKEDYSVPIVKSYIHAMSGPGVHVQMGFQQREMWSQGDRVSIALLKIYSPKELKDAAVVHSFLPAIHGAFEDLTRVESEYDRKPAVTLFLLTSIERDVQDLAVKREITDLIAYVKLQTARVSTPDSH